MSALILREGLGKTALALETFGQPLMSGGVVRIQLQRAAKLLLGQLQLRIKKKRVA